MKKICSLLLCLCLLLCAFSGCRKAPEQQSGKEEIQIVTTIFPIYDWVRQIVGEKNEKVQVTMLMNKGVDMHSYQPTVDDIMEITSCDLFVYVGGESDDWAENVLAEAENGSLKVLSLLDILGERVKEEEITEGMEAEKGNGEEIPEYDEHVWLSLKNAQVFCKSIAEALGEADPANREAYAANCLAYTEKLKTLDGEYQATADASAVKTVLFADRFPFRYLTDDYGLTYYAAFAGCSAESEASFDTIIFLANKVDELHLGAILQIESADGSIARTVRENTVSQDQEILTLNSLQSVTKTDIEKGITYLSVMEENLAALQKALR